MQLDNLRAAAGGAGGARGRKKACAAAGGAHALSPPLCARSRPFRLPTLPPNYPTQPAGRRGGEHG